MRILHAAFQDPDQPNSGGGARRVYELVRRLGVRHEITVLTAPYPRSHPARKYNATFVPLGPRSGYFGGMLSYLVGLPIAMRSLDFDLLVEEFAPPFGTCFAPVFTERPVIASVQWLFAGAMAEKYGLPFQFIETPSARLYKHFITLTEHMHGKLSSANPLASYAVIPNGVDREALETEMRDEGYVLFLGRIDIHQKGLDLLLQAFRRIHSRTRSTLVVAGGGPDVPRFVRLIESHGLAGVVRVIGHVAGRDRFDLLAGARLTCVPSRYETFGMVALESLACGTPVIGFDIDCLREVVVPGTGRLVPPYDTEQLTDAIVDLLENPDQARAMGVAGRSFASDYDWDRLAEMQEQYYVEVSRGLR